MDEMNIDPKPNKYHYSFQTVGAKFIITEKRLDFETHPIGEADIELELQMNQSQKIINQLFEHIDKIKGKDIYYGNHVILAFVGLAVIVAAALVIVFGEFI